MPRLSIEYWPKLKARTSIAELYCAPFVEIVDSEIFPTAGIRIRAHKADHAIVADGHKDNDFLAMTLSVGAESRSDQLNIAGDALFAAARTALSGPLATRHFELSLETRVIDPALSWKDRPIHERLWA